MAKVSLMDRYSRRPTVPIGHRRSLRRPGYDYATPGIYYVTMVIQYRACILGRIEGGRMVLSHTGLMIESWWGNIAARFPTVQLDAFVVMPNHLHGLIRLDLAAHDECTSSSDADPIATVALDKVIQWFKSATTRDYQIGVERYGWPAYPGRLWQRNYHDHIVRDPADLARIQTYIRTNPTHWTDDDEYRLPGPGFE